MQKPVQQHNHRQYGWLIPAYPIYRHSNIPRCQHTFGADVVQATAPSTSVESDSKSSNRVIAGRGKLEEVSLAVDSTPPSDIRHAMKALLQHR